jgi:hypothetical protein
MVFIWYKLTFIKHEVLCRGSWENMVDKVSFVSLTKVKIWNVVCGYAIES